MTRCGVLDFPHRLHGWEAGQWWQHQGSVHNSWRQSTSTTTHLVMPGEHWQHPGVTQAGGTGDDLQLPAQLQHLLQLLDRILCTSIAD